MNKTLFKLWFLFISFLAIGFLVLFTWAVIRLVPAFEHLLNSIPME